MSTTLGTQFDHLLWVQFHLNAIDKYFPGLLLCDPQTGGPRVLRKSSPGPDEESILDQNSDEEEHRPLHGHGEEVSSHQVPREWRDEAVLPCKHNAEIQSEWSTREHGPSSNSPLFLGTPMGIPHDKKKICKRVTTVQAWFREVWGKHTATQYRSEFQSKTCIRSVASCKICNVSFLMRCKNPL